MGQAMMRTITLPVFVPVVIIISLLFLWQLVINRRCKALKECLLPLCTELFNTIEELRNLAAKVQDDHKEVTSGLASQISDIAERERQTTSRLKNTVKDAL